MLTEPSLGGGKMGDIKRKMFEALDALLMDKLEDIARKEELESSTGGNEHTRLI